MAGRSCSRKRWGSLACGRDGSSHVHVDHLHELYHAGARQDSFAFQAHHDHLSFMLLKHGKPHLHLAKRFLAPQLFVDHGQGSSRRKVQEGADSGCTCPWFA